MRRRPPGYGDCQLSIVCAIQNKKSGKSMLYTPIHKDIQPSSCEQKHACVYTRVYLTKE